MYLVMKAHYKEKVGPNILVVEINSEVLDQLNRAKAWIEGDHSRAFRRGSGHQKVLRRTPPRRNRLAATAGAELRAGERRSRVSDCRGRRWQKGP